MAAAVGHVIVCGLSDLGLRITEQLIGSGVAVVVVDDRYAPTGGRQLERWAARLVVESPHTAEALCEAGVDTALAVVACHESDLANLQTAMVTAETAPAVRLVLSIDNAQLGDQLAAALPQARVLNRAELASPGFVMACVRSDVLHAFTLNRPGAGGPTSREIFTVVDERVERPGIFRDIYGDLTPISLHRRGERLVEICPPRDVSLRPGDRLTVIGRTFEYGARDITVAGLDDARLFSTLVGYAAEGTGEDLAGVTSSRGRPAGPTTPAAARRRNHALRSQLELHATRRHPGTRLSETAAMIRSEFDRPFRWALAAVLTVMGVSTVVLSLAYESHNPEAPAGFSPLDALYLTVETMVTVGYGDFNFGAADNWLQAFGIVLMLAGALSIAVVYAFITNVIISRRLERALGRGRIGAIDGHVVLCGLGSVGLATMEGLLLAGRQVVVIERDETNPYLPVARELRVPVVIGDAAVRSTLLEAGMPRATTIAALSSDGAANLEAVLSAREAHDEQPERIPDTRLRVVLRTSGPTMADEVERLFDVHTARSASALATPYFVGAALGYHVISTFYVKRTPFLVARMTVHQGSALAGPTLEELATGTRVLAVGAEKAELEYRVSRHTRLRPGDELLVTGPVTQIIDMVRRNQPVAAGRRPDPPQPGVTGVG
ncbi:NAD-binding protein [Parafrankia elaeagni]|uniref:NAD-binding protein n=1 Tax=Parafrankia elaeagni TaxID=222534 RepID=UPI00035DA490|nr:NAD-binding protein [Parafrankia elaeagni]